MIDLRYHIVSIMAVFLALGLGILLGSSVVSDALDTQLRANLERANQRRDDAEQRADELGDRVATLGSQLGEAAPWALAGRLAGSRFILVADGTEEALQNHVRDSLSAAGAEPFGRLVLEERLALAEAGDREALVEAITSIVPACAGDTPAGDCFDAGEEDLASAALRVVARRFRDAVGEILVDALVEAGFMSAPERPDGDWPSSDALVVFLASGRSDVAEPTPGALTFVRAVSETTPTLVVTSSTERASLVSDLRDERGLSDLLSTFDAATEEADRGGIGVFAALVAATEGRGGHFGTDGDRFVAPAPGPD